MLTFKNLIHHKWSPFPKGEGCGERVPPLCKGSEAKPRALNESPVDARGSPKRAKSSLGGSYETPRCIQRILPSEQMIVLISTYTSTIAKYDASGKHESADETNEVAFR